ncbi:sensor domain-containing phosphodiesterase [Pararhizobium sp. DWP1-1-3]|uniref:sensor domain-containing phosphodiesterase n=1 Tax=Pararhizobium sp. DWP1-1-3 TaxID=2804652 RepID=UPI003CF53101
MKKDCISTVDPIESWLRRNVPTRTKIRIDKGSLFETNIQPLSNISHLISRLNRRDSSGGAKMSWDDQHNCRIQERKSCSRSGGFGLTWAGSGPAVNAIKQILGVASRRARTHSTILPVKNVTSATGRVNARELYQALSTDQIWPAFQPLVDFHHGKIIGFEVLARWTHPVRGAISPADFIPVAEAAGHIDLLTERIVSSACRQAGVWGDDFSLAFNISAMQFKDPGLFSWLARIIGAPCFPLNRIEIEVTESALIEHTDVTLATMASMRSVGMRLALDDFGTGFASLSRLHSFPFDKIKIDCSFVRSLVSDSGSRRIVASVVGLGQNLGLTVVAEGVETQQQAHILKRMGCDVAQGWLFGKPLPAKQAGILFAREEQTDGTALLPVVPQFQRIHQLEALYQTAPIGLCLLGADLVHLSVNDRFAAMLKLTPEQMIGKRVQEFLPLQEADRIEAILKNALAGEGTGPLEFQSPSGGVYLVINERVNDDAGDTVGISVTAIDITQKKAFEGLLLHHEDQFRQSLALGPSILWEADETGKLIDISPTEERDVLEVEERILAWQDRIHPDDQIRVRTEWLAHLGSPDPFKTRFRLRLPNGACRWVSSKALPSEPTQSRGRRWYGVINDISEQVALEELITKLSRFEEEPYSVCAPEYAVAHCRLHEPAGS